MILLRFPDEVGIAMSSSSVALDLPLFLVGVMKASASSSPRGAWSEKRTEREDEAAELEASGPDAPPRVGVAPDMVAVTCGPGANVASPCDVELLQYCSLHVDTPGSSPVDLAPRASFGRVAMKLEPRFGYVIASA